MAEPKFSEGDEFETPNGRAVVTGLYSEGDPIKYSMRYEDEPGQPVSPLAESELENNDEITEV